MSFEAAHDAYPINQRMIWLNNAGLTPAGQHVIDRMAEHFEILSQQGPLALEAMLGRVGVQVKQYLGSLINASPRDLTLVHNTAEGMNLVSLGLQLSPGDRILLLENEYPSNVYPWQVWQERGVALDFISPGTSPDQAQANFIQALDERVKLVALSAVHWCTGMPLPLEPIAAACHQLGALLVVDGSQGVGMVPVDFAKLAPAVLCFSAWKWLLGPLGLAGLCMDRETLGRLRMPFKGTDSVANPRSYLPYQSELRNTVDRYAISTSNYNDWVYLEASLTWLHNLGFERVQARILELTGRLWAGLEALGFRSGYRHAAPQSGILSVNRPGLDVDRLSKELEERQIVARVRLNRLRLAPHVYLSPSQMDRTVQAIAELAG